MSVFELGDVFYGSFGVNDFIHLPFHLLFGNGIRERGVQTVNEYFFHPGSGSEPEGFDETYIFLLTYHDGIAVLGGDIDGLIVFNSILHYGINVFSEIGYGRVGHWAASFDTYIIAYAFADVNRSDGSLLKKRRFCL